MNYFLFDRVNYDRLYNCSMLSHEEWVAKKSPNAIMGFTHLGLSTMYQTLYLPFLVVMLKDYFWQHSCYKLMFLLGTFDVCATLIGGTFAGIFSIRGDIFCTNPTFIYLVGCFQATFWSTSCMTSIVLLFNRILDLINKKYAELLFEGSKTYLWFSIPFGVGFYMWFYTTPFLFNSILHASFLSPFFGVPEIKYDNEFCAIHNYVVAGIFPLMYVSLCIALVVKMKMPYGQTSEGISKVQKRILTQSIILSVVLAITSVTYMVMQYVPVPVTVIVASHFMWQASHGASVFTYIFINKTIGNEVVATLKISWAQK